MQECKEIEFNLNVPKNKEPWEDFQNRTLNKMERKERVQRLITSWYTSNINYDNFMVSQSVDSDGEQAKFNDFFMAQKI